MADEHGSAPPFGIGLRQGVERRNGDRRKEPRDGRDRRRRDRRRARLRNLFLTALTFAIPSHLRHSGLGPPKANVSVSVDSFDPIPASKAYDHIIQEAADRYSLDPILIRSVMRTESAFNPNAVSRVGAMGLMQLMPSVADSLGVENAFDPRENIMAGARLLRELLDRYRGNLALTLAGYNAGPGAVEKHGRAKMPPFKETRNYVKRITGLIADARANND